MTTKHIWFSVAFLATVMTASGAPVHGVQQPDDLSAEALLGAALHQEEVEGNLDAAIATYRELLARPEISPALAANALVRMAACYETLGRPEARDAYERVLRDYADQAEQVSAARTRLAALGQDPRDTRPSGLVARRVWDGPGVDLEGAPSPDGRDLTYVDWSTGDLAIHTLASGEDRRLTNKGSWEDSRQYAGGSTPSPDGTLVAYGWNNADDFYELRVIGVDGSAPRVLYSNPAVPYLMPHAWSPDGTQILAMFVREDDSAQIVLVSVADGSVSVLKSQDWRWSNNRMSVSPDGRYIAYDFPPVEDAPERDLFLLSTDGSREMPLVEHPANDQTPVWTPDGKTILFASDRTGEMALWAIDVADDAPTGPARVVRTEMGRFFTPLGISAAGSYYYGQATGQVDLFVTPLDQTTGRSSAAPVKLTQRVEGASRLPDWSPDGRHLAYVRGPGFNPQSLTASADDDVIVIRSVDTGVERELRPDLSIIRRMGWSRDGDWLLLTGVGPQRRPGIYRVDIESGSTTLLLRKELIDVNPPSALPVVSADGTTMFHTHHIGSGGVGQFPGEGRILAHDLRTGEEREIYQGPAGASITGLVLSPDGQQLAFSTFAWETSSGSLQVMPAAGGDARRLPTSSGVASPLRWSPDGRTLFFGAMTPPGPGELWRISLDGGEPVRIDLQTDTIGDLSVHPDGQTVVFSAGEPAAEVWVLENLLAELDAAR